MPQIEKSVFISYRRTNVGFALAIYQNLIHNGYDVFFDYESIKSGDFGQIILNQIAARAHFVVLLTPSALERCNEPGDWLRREIEYALDLKRNIVPLMFEGFSFDDVDQYLTEKLAILKNYNAMTVPIEYFDAAMEKLRTKFLNIALETILHPTPLADRSAVAATQAKATSQPPTTEKRLTAEDWYEKGFKLNDNSDEEIACYTEAIRLNPQYAEAYNNRGVVHKAIGNLDGAIADYTEAIRLDPQYVTAYNNRGIVLRAIGNLDGAIADYTEAIRLNSLDSDAYYNRGIVLRAIGNLDGAIADYTEAIRLKPQHADAYNNRGVAYATKRVLNAAITDYTEAIRLDPQYADAYNNRGVAYATKRVLNAAITDYTEAIRLKPQYADAYYNRASAYNRKGLRDLEISDYESVLRINPNDEDAKNNLKIARDKKAKGQ